MVDELIDNEQLCWSEKKLEENIIETNKPDIHQIPLGHFAEDEWAWTQEKSRLFLVHSAYRPNLQGLMNHKIMYGRSFGGYRFLQKCAVSGGE
jgi:hypothetical protein